MMQRNISAAILAGGKSSRMGRDKGLLELNGKPMVEHVLLAAKAVTDQVQIIANDPRYTHFGYPVFEDDFREKGPLGGIYTALKNAENENCFILSCDVPGITPALLQTLFDQRREEDITIVSFNGRMHPLIGIYSKKCLPVVQEKINAAQLKVTGIFDVLQARIIAMDTFDAGNFRNINTSEDL